MRRMPEMVTAARYRQVVETMHDQSAQLSELDAEIQAHIHAVTVARQEIARLRRIIEEARDNLTGGDEWGAQQLLELEIEER